MVQRKLAVNGPLSGMLTGMPFSWLWVFSFLLRHHSSYLDLCPAASTTTMQQPLAIPVIPRRHMELVIPKGGIGYRFNTPCPESLVRLPDWLSKFRSNVKASRAGVHWREQRVLVNGQAPQIIDQTVPFYLVFDTLNDNA